MCVFWPRRKAIRIWVTKNMTSRTQLISFTIKSSDVFTTHVLIQGKTQLIISTIERRVILITLMPMQVYLFFITPRFISYFLLANFEKLAL